MRDAPYRELFVEVADIAPCPWCRSMMKELDEDGGVRCERCGARSLPLDARREIAKERVRSR
jgi:DNA-directed RNA polymerase subunit RPC12/RpoP